MKRSIIMRLQNADGFALHLYQWRPAVGHAPRGVVQLLHGASEHARRYEGLAQVLTAAGYLVYAHDQRGHGQTAGCRDKMGIVGADGWSGFVRDAHQVGELIEQQHSDLPLFLFGHSMGAALAQRAMQLWGEHLHGVILSGPSAPALNLEPIVALAEQAAQAEPNAPSMLASQMFAALNAPFAPGKTGYEWLSRDEKAVQAYVDDPWCGFPFCNRLAADLYAGLHALWQPQNMARIPQTLPLLVLAGEADPVGGNTVGVQALLAHYQQLGVLDLSHKFYPAARHEVLNEINREEVHCDIVEWLNAHL
jgi:alpha-beta hydrolase superfamily lysophospholipase